jgi:hypothetical protein
MVNGVNGAQVMFEVVFDFFEVYAHHLRRLHIVGAMFVAIDRIT